MEIKINLELRGSQESDFILRYNSTNKRKFVFIIEDFFLSVMRYRPVDRIRSQMHKILNSKIEFPILNIKLVEHILIRGSESYEIANLFSSESQQPMHFFLTFQNESVWSGDLNKPETNPYRFPSCGIDKFSFRHGDYKFPSSTFSSSG